MSGIALSYGRAEEGRLESMLSRIKHRGSSQEIQVDSGIGVGLIASDESLPQQIALDGQVFFRDNGDCGKPLSFQQLNNCYLRYGTDCLKYFNGAFAFAIAQGGKLFVARDPFGLKPLYYGIKSGTMYFASEIKALVDITSKIYTVPPGFYFHTDEGWVHYYKQIPHEYTEMDLSDVLQKLRRLLRDAIRLRASHGRPGIFLSGGIDSSVVAAAARELNPSLKSFAVGAPGSADLPKAEMVAKHLGLKHQELIYQPEEVLKILPKVIYHLESFDQYLVRSAVANYMLAQMAADAGIAEVFCGEGGDELFAGYDYLKEFSSEQKIQQELDTLTLNGHSNGFQRVDRMTSAFKLEGHLPFMDMAVSELAFSIPISWKLKEKKVEKWVLRQAFAEELPEEIVWREKMKFFEGAGSQDLLARRAEESITDEEFDKERFPAPGFTLRSKEELMYYRIYREYFPYRMLLDTIGRTRTISK